jgi:glycosyltransferase involved in cell wall biosynthesis
VIGECLDLLSFADERLVLVDAATTDHTREVARARGARVEERAFDNFAAQRDAALALATGAWVLFVDADERVTADLRTEVLAAIEAPGEVRGFWIPRHNVILGRVVRAAGWYPDYQLRLLERRAARFDPRRVVHEVAIVDGGLGYIRSPLVHLNYRSLGEFVRKQERYAQLEARRWLVTYGRPRSRAVLGQAVREFWRRFVVLRGYREGALGLVLSSLLAVYTARAVWLARRRGAQVLQRPDDPDAGQKISE